MKTEAEVFREKFHKAVSAMEAWIEAPPPDCIACKRPYAEHVDDEHCPGKTDTDYWCGPEWYYD